MPTITIQTWHPITQKWRFQAWYIYNSVHNNTLAGHKYLHRQTFTYTDVLHLHRRTYYYSHYCVSSRWRFTSHDPVMDSWYPHAIIGHIQ